MKLQYFLTKRPDKALPFLLCLMVSCFINSLASWSALAQKTPYKPAPTINQLYEQVREDPQRLRLFLRDFPKGGDLHNQLKGAIYAETLLRWAGRDNLCVSLNMGRILPAPCGVSTHNEQPAALLPKDATSWNHLIAALSMRDFVPTVGDRSAHDHFFGAFDRFAAIEKTHHAEMLAEALKQAARNHVSYVEFAISPFASSTVSVEGRPRLKQASDLPHVHEDLLRSLPDLTRQVQQEITDMEAKAHGLLSCGEKNEEPACHIEVRYLFQAARDADPIVVFTELEMGYLLTQNSPSFVGVTLTGAEDSPTALAGYHLHMEMLHYLNDVYKNVRLSLPAGELTPSLVPPENLSNHIHLAIDAGASRIAQGLDMTYEDNVSALLQTMAQRTIAIELNLTRNEVLTGLKGQDHPFALFERTDVPIVLTSDSQGVFRKDLTEQYALAASRYTLSYNDLVRLSRTSLELSFLKGQSLWVSPRFSQKAKACAAEEVSGKPSRPCAAFLQKNTKARLEWSLEVALKDFATRTLKDIVLTR